MTGEIVSVICGGPGPKFPPVPTRFTPFINTSNIRTPCQCYQESFLNVTCVPETVPEVIIWMHDDIEIFDPEWLPKVLAVFSSHPDCIAVGLGGATSLGRESLYKRPYRISDMARGDYASAQRDWSVHGTYLDGVRRVAVLDAFFLAVRTNFLREVSGWPVGHIGHHGIDLWLACEAARQEKEIWAVGIDCVHSGGGTSTKPVYRDAKWLQGGGLVSDHEAPHKWLWQEYRDVLPIRIRP